MASGGSSRDTYQAVIYEVEDDQANASEELPFGSRGGIAVRHTFPVDAEYEITVTRALPPFVHDYRTVVITMIPFVCVLAPGSSAPHAHEHVALAWVTPAELRTYDLAAADWPVVEAMLSR